MNIEQLRQQRAGLLGQMKAILAGAEAAKRSMTADERVQFDALKKQAEELKADIARAEALEAEVRDLSEPTTPANHADPATPQTRAPNLNLKTKRGDDETKAVVHYMRTGDARALGQSEARASNNTDMNIGTPADGGYAVPTGHYQGIVARRDEVRLSGRLGVQDIPGIGTTVNVPLDDGTANEFVSTAETIAMDQDAPALNQASTTLVLYTKKIVMSYELLRDEDSRIMNFLDDYVGRALGLTHNKLLVTEALAGGTAVTLGGAAVATAGDPELLTYGIKSEYLEGCSFLLKRATEGKIRVLASANQFLYQNTPNGVARPNGATGELAGFPVFNSTYVPAIGAGNKSVIFGNFSFMGLREPGGMQFLRDPYSGGNTKQLILYYYFSAVYKTLQAEAILYGKHPTA